MFKWIKSLFFPEQSRTTLRDTPLSPQVQEDPRTQEAIKRTRAAFKEQEQAMNTRALKPHSAACKDPLACKTKKCFKWAPDKIVSGTKVIETEDQVQYRMSKKKGVYKS
jgi:hypothetical protein